jgi:hypothetical protein
MQWIFSRNKPERNQGDKFNPDALLRGMAYVSH